MLVWGVGCEVGSAGELVWVWDEECWGGGWGGSAGMGGGVGCWGGGWDVRWGVLA